MAHKPIRIAQVVGKVVMGGVDAVVMNYYRNIDRTKYQFDFFMEGLDPTAVDEEICALGGRIFKLPAYDENFLDNMKGFRQVIKANNYPIVHCHMNTLSVFWLREARKAGVPVRIAHSHSTAAKGETKRNIVKYALRPFSKVYANAYATCSHYAGNWLFGEDFYGKGKVQLVHNAIDVNAFSYHMENRNKIRRRLNLENRFVIGHVGRFMFQKNHEYLIQIFRYLHTENPQARLLLVGDGPRRAEMESLVARLGLEDVVIFTGIRTDVPDLMQAMDVFVFPSRYEGLGLVAVEAQAAGLPCFVADVVPLEVMLTDQCKFLNIQQSPQIWAKQILAADTSRRTTPYKQLEDKGYSIQTEARALVAFYDSLLHGVQS